MSGSGLGSVSSLALCVCACVCVCVCARARARCLFNRGRKENYIQDQPIGLKTENLGCQINPSPE
jgi:hypothetical protein